MIVCFKVDIKLRQRAVSAVPIFNNYVLFYVIHPDTKTVTLLTGNSTEEEHVCVTFLGVERLERSEPVVLCLEVGLLGMW